MLPGPIVIKKCSECSASIKEHTTTSGNTFGATFWSDGKRDAPMLPEHFWLVKCPHCQALIWIDEQEKIGKIEQFSDNEEAYKGAKSYSVPELKNYFAVLKKNNLGRKKEHYLRLHAWWAGNNNRRGTNKIKQLLSDEEKVNLEALGKMLDPSDDNDRIMMAEIKRELSQFEEAEDILKEPFANDLSQAVSIIRELIQRRDSYVAEMKFDN
ncbi:MAG: hypothetical protein U9R50_06405 [Campylobacterota bacterium]|nr:hypothetical protein [Campylobacterota bacterium]